MPSDLERIEEKHWCHICDENEPYPCDLVKLARVLDWIANDCDVGAYYACVDKAERILREVAGEDLVKALRGEK